MPTVGMHEAKTRLSELVAEAERGGEVILSRNGVPVARLVPIGGLRPEKRFGAMAGRARSGDAFFDPLPEEELAAWE